MRKFIGYIRELNEKLLLPANNVPTAPTVQVLRNIKNTLAGKVCELDDIIQLCDKGYELDILTRLSGLLGDLMVYQAAFATSQGLPVPEIVDIICEANLALDDGPEIVKTINNKISTLITIKKLSDINMVQDVSREEAAKLLTNQLGRAKS